MPQRYVAPTLRAEEKFRVLSKSAEEKTETQETESEGEGRRKQRNEEVHNLSSCVIIL
jgi:hypothetical protein